jgi:hypothetical protein
MLKLSSTYSLNCLYSENELKVYRENELIRLDKRRSILQVECYNGILRIITEEAFTIEISGNNAKFTLYKKYKFKEKETLKSVCKFIDINRISKISFNLLIIIYYKLFR